MKKQGEGSSEDGVHLLGAVLLVELNGLIEVVRNGCSKTRSDPFIENWRRRVWCIVPIRALFVALVRRLVKVVG